MSAVDLARLVKPLVWVAEYKRNWRAECVAGRYAIQLDQGRYDYWPPQYDDDAWAPEHFDTLAAAQAAADADHAARVLAALDAELLGELVGAARSVMSTDIDSMECHEACVALNAILAKLGVQP